MEFISPLSISGPAPQPKQLIVEKKVLGPEERELLSLIPSASEREEGLRIIQALRNFPSNISWSDNWKLVVDGIAYQTDIRQVLAHFFAKTKRSRPLPGETAFLKFLASQYFYPKSAMKRMRVMSSKEPATSSSSPVFHPPKQEAYDSDHWYYVGEISDEED